VQTFSVCLQHKNAPPGEGLTDSAFCIAGDQKKCAQKEKKAGYNATFS
jgi:hypothetical protein